VLREALAEAGARKSKRRRRRPSISICASGDEAIVAGLIRDLSIYEKMENECIVTPEAIREQLFGARPAAEALIARVGGTPAAFALFFQNFSTFLARPGLYLEDLFVKPEYRKLGIGTALLRRMASLCVERGYGRMEWATLEWNELAKGRWRAIGAVPMKEWCTSPDGLRCAKWATQAQAQEQGRRSQKPRPRCIICTSRRAFPRRLRPFLRSVSSASARIPRAIASASAKRVVIYTDGGSCPSPAWAGPRARLQWQDHGTLRRRTRYNK
jgi:GNAT superfamily N-acetyltransferase